MSNIVTRFAPSPTGDLHLGGARTALFNYLLAKKRGGKFLLRIEDTDQARHTDSATRAIFDGLQWLGIEHDETVVFQSDNRERHAQVARELVAKEKAYYAFETREELLAQKTTKWSKYNRAALKLSPAEVEERLRSGMPYVIRFLVPEGVTEWQDGVRGAMRIKNSEVEDFVILRSDGSPVYNLAVVVDDHDAGVTQVMRGEDHLSNTSKQILLYQAMGWDVPLFSHVPMILGSDGEKLSKRHGATAVGAYAEMGILPEAMRNALVLLGWAPGGNKEFITDSEIVELFDETRLLKKPSVFDMKKLLHYNQLHMRSLDTPELSRRLGAFLAKEAAPEVLEPLVECVREKTRTLVELRDQVLPFLEDISLDDDQKNALQSRAACDHFLRATGRLEGLGDAELQAELKKLPLECGMEMRDYFADVRLGLTGRTVSPPMHSMLRLLGWDRVRERLGRVSGQRRVGR